jgi:hypothetical protein
LNSSKAFSIRDCLNWNQKKISYLRISFKALRHYSSWQLRMAWQQCSMSSKNCWIHWLHPKWKFSIIWRIALSIETFNQCFDKLFNTLFLFRYIDSVAEKLKHIESLSERALNRSKLMENKRIAVLEELRLLEPQIPLLINKTRELQKKVNYW